MARSPAPAAEAPAPPLGLCAAWSSHAAELAVPIGDALQEWEDTPSTRVLVAEGLLARLLPGRYVPPDVLHGAIPRALALGCAMGARLLPHHVIAGPSAAWVLLGGVPPTVPELLSATHRSAMAGVSLRHGMLRPDEVETVGGAPMTVPERTAIDLLRYCPVPAAAPLLRGLERSGHLERGAVDRALRRMDRHPGIRAVRGRWEEYLERSAPRRDFLRGRAPQGGILRPRAPGSAQLAVSGAEAPTGLPSAVTR
ncbi:hypothetical protein [Brachybacterium saurashtrense]|uniref:AbiEi antitoxin C-terminal domain-containing protein n=1 Tax=Brachybacterium saurashtrense TaxID=556288 RepID=A0A345YLY9_9MICO|nr:hypothetical protein [Brachybacterium saurashtrense]AXK44941.1 hypothetical protein DWV08_04500 [Brachybacterium saurashtrense]RRR21625.1 hypothetical protein DXU92_13075 [Brachybacterium saurashtrense]